MTSLYEYSEHKKVHTVDTFMSPCQDASEGAKLAVTKPAFEFGLWNFLSAPEVMANRIVTFICLDGFQGHDSELRPLWKYWVFVLG